MDVSVILSASGIKCNAVKIRDYKTQLKVSYIFSYLSTLCLFLGEYDDKGLTRHIIVNGLGWFGGCLFIGVTLGTIDLANASADSPSLQRLIINNLIICMGTGLTFGLVTWYATEYMYQKQVKAADQK